MDAMAASMASPIPLQFRFRHNKNRLITTALSKSSPLPSRHSSLRQCLVLRDGLTGCGLVPRGIHSTSSQPARRHRNPSPLIPLAARSTESDAFSSNGGTTAEALNPASRASLCPAPRVQDGATFSEERLPDSACREGLEVSATGGEALGGRSALGLNRTNFAALSASTHRPPPFTAASRPGPPSWVTLGVLVSVSAAAFWAVLRGEERARKQLGAPGEEAEVALPPPSPAMVERFERAKAFVAQERLIERALAALRMNDLVRCVVEVELAMEENRLSRVGIEKDFYDPEEILDVYKVVLKVWLDGYPPNYANLLQLRNMLQVPNDVAERLEEDIQRQADVFVI